MNTRVLVLRNIADIRDAVTDRRATGLFVHIPIRLELPQLDQAELQAWEHRLNRRQWDCGCFWGAVFLFCGSLGALVLCLLQARTFWSLAVIAAFARAAIFGGVVALPGKLFGLWLAKFRLKKSYRALLKMIAEPTLLPKA